jgi:biopolymer transport protein TolR
MAYAAGAAQGGRRRRRVRRGGAMNEINMTPFIDVMLVLLQTKAAQLNVDSKPVTLSIKASGQVFIGEDQLSDQAVVGKLAEVARQGFDERIYVRGDKAVDYGRVAQIMSLVTGAGYKKVALVTELDQR